MFATNLVFFFWGNLFKKPNISDKTSYFQNGGHDVISTKKRYHLVHAYAASVRRLLHLPAAR